MDKQNVIYPYNGILFDIQRNEVQIHTIMEMNLGHRMLNEREQSSTEKHILYDSIYMNCPE